MDEGLRAIILELACDMRKQARASELIALANTHRIIEDACLDHRSDMNFEYEIAKAIERLALQIAKEV